VIPWPALRTRLSSQKLQAFSVFKFVPRNEGTAEELRLKHHHTPPPYSCNYWCYLRIVFSRPDASREMPISLQPLDRDRLHHNVFHRLVLFAAGHVGDLDRDIVTLYDLAEDGVLTG
jgi:hypothetical protein